MFVERALPTNLVPNRDLGFMLWGQPFYGALEYDLGGARYRYDLAGNRTPELYTRAKVTAAGSCRAWTRMSYARP